MVSLLLIISFLLHIILLAAVFILFQQLQKARDEHNELDNMLANFLQEIRAENERLQRQFRDKPVFEKPVISEQNTISPDFSSTLNKEIEVHEPPILNEKTDPKDQLETSIESQVLHLYKRGLPLEEIAQQLNRGKTEVELIIKLVKNE